MFVSNYLSRQLKVTLPISTSIFFVLLFSNSNRTTIWDTNRNLTGPVTVTINLSANVTYVYINGSFAMFHTHPAIFRRTNVSSLGTKYGIGTWCGTGMRFQNFSFTGQK